MVKNVILKILCLIPFSVGLLQLSLPAHSMEDFYRFRAPNRIQLDEEDMQRIQLLRSKLTVVDRLPLLTEESFISDIELLFPHRNNLFTDGLGNYLLNADGYESEIVSPRDFDKIYDFAVFFRSLEAAARSNTIFSSEESTIKFLDEMQEIADFKEEIAQIFETKYKDLMNCYPFQIRKFNEVFTKNGFNLDPRRSHLLSTVILAMSEQLNSKEVGNSVLSLFSSFPLDKKVRTQLIAYKNLIAENRNLGDELLNKPDFRAFYRKNPRSVNFLIEVGHRINALSNPEILHRLVQQVPRNFDLSKEEAFSLVDFLKGKDLENSYKLRSFFIEIAFHRLYIQTFKMKNKFFISENGQDFYPIRYGYSNSIDGYDTYESLKNIFILQKRQNIRVEEISLLRKTEVERKLKLHKLSPHESVNILSAAKLHFSSKDNGPNRYFSMYQANDGSFLSLGIKPEIEEGITVGWGHSREYAIFLGPQTIGLNKKTLHLLVLVDVQ